MSEKEGTSHLVWAEKFKLKTPASIKNGTWKVNGDREGDKGKLVSRQFVKDMNEINKEGHSLKNMIYVIDEKKTVELMKYREENIKQQVIQKEQEGVGQGDMVKAIVGLGEMVKGQQPESKKQKPFNEMNQKELRMYCVENDIEYHPSAKETKLIETIENSQKQA